MDFREVSERNFDRSLLHVVNARLHGRSNPSRKRVYAPAVSYDGGYVAVGIYSAIEINVLVTRKTDETKSLLVDDACRRGSELCFESGI